MRSLKRAAIVAALAVSAFAASTTAAQAATLNGGSVGDTTTGVSGSVVLDGPLNSTCTSSTLTASVEAAGPPEVRARITASSWSGCSISPVTGHHGAGKWILRTSDTSNPYSGRVDAVDVNVGATCRFSGNLVDSSIGGPSGSTVQFANGSPSQIQLNDAGTLTGAPLFPCFTGRIDGNWNIAAGWTLSP